MKFLIDAHLPRRMVRWLADAGCNAIHTFDLPLGNRTPDKDVTQIVDRDERILVTKDGDFVDSHLLLHRARQQYVSSLHFRPRAVAENNR